LTVLFPFVIRTRSGLPSLETSLLLHRGNESPGAMFSPCLYLVFNDPVEELVVDRYGADVHGARRPRFW
jgi:hypothetical protein